MSPVDEHIVACGKRYTVEYAICHDGSMPARIFLENELAPRDRQHLKALFQHLADNGEQAMWNNQVFKSEKNGFWAFKRKVASSPLGKNGMARIPCFRLENLWILTHGFWKPAQSKWPEHEFAVAERIRQEFLTFETQKAAAMRNNHDGPPSQ